MAEIRPISGFDDRVKLADALPLDMPFTLNIFPINACNFRCRYCAQSLGAKKLKELYGYERTDAMKLDTLETLLIQAGKFKDRFKVVCFMGHGEPLLNRQLPEMIARVKSSGIARRIEVITNAFLLTPQLSERLISAGLDRLRISFQGMSAKRVKEICDARIDYESFIENIRYFYNCRGDCKVLVKIMDIALAEGEDVLFYQTFENIADAMYIEKVRPVYKGVDVGIGIDQVTTDRYGTPHPRRRVCPLAFYMLAVWPNGDVVPCDAIYKPIVLGNVHHGELTAMWHSEKLNQFQQELLRRKKEFLSGCRECCAPDDVSHPLDELDSCADNLIRNFSYG